MSDVNDDEEHDDRTTAELLNTLNDDYLRCHQSVIMRLNFAERDPEGLILSDTGFESRQLVRSVFAYIEGATFVLKIEATFNAEENGIELLPQQNHFIFEADFELNDRGEIVQRPAKINLTKNIRFAFAVFAEANGLENLLDTGELWWSKLQDSIRVRDRLMHPRFPDDLDVSSAETIAMIEAKSGFDNALHKMLAARSA